MIRNAARGGLLTNVVTAALPFVGSFVVSLLLAPYVGDAGFGLYSLVMSVATLLLVVAKFGIHTATSRLVSENDDAPGPWIRAGLLLRVPFTVVTALGAWLLGPWLGPLFTGTEGSSVAFALAGAIVIGASAFEFLGDVYVGLRAFRSQLVLRLVVLVLRLVALALVRMLGLGVEWFLFGHALSQAVPAAVASAHLVWTTRMQPKGDLPTLRRTWEISVPLAFSSASFLIYAHTDRLMLGLFHEPAVVGQYAVARNVIDAALFPVVAITWSLRPTLVRALRPDAEAPVRAVLADGLRLSILYVAAGSVLLGVLGPALLRGLYGEGFTHASQLLLWLIPVLALRGLGTIAFPALVAADAQSTYARLMTWTALTNVVANLVLIPPLGAEGAILGTVIALVLLTVGGFRAVEQRLGRLPWGDERSAHLRAGIVSIGAGALLWLWDPASRGLPALIVAAVAGTSLLAVVGFGLPGRRRHGSGRSTRP